MKQTLLALLLTTQAFAADVNLIKRSVVKIVSTVQGVSAELHGTGVLFQKGGKRYVITSDHVTGHTNGSLGDHTATNSVTGETLKLNFLVAEWGNGLALMEVLNDKNPANAIPYTDFQTPTTAKVGDRVSFYGYPYESSDLTEETFAKLLNESAPVPYYVFPRTLVEMEAAVGEFGMSGGGAFSSTGEFLGVLAYQRILDSTLVSPAVNRVYAISRSVTVAWLDEYFQQGSKFLPVFSEPWFAQGDPRQLLVTNDGLLLMFHVFNGRYRFGIGRMEHLMVLKDGPTVPFHDKRGFMKALHQYMKDNPLRPSEFGLVDRSTGKPVLRRVKYPAEVFTAFDEPKISMFLILGERHEERFQRMDTAAQKLDQEKKAADAAIQTPEWKAISTDLAALQKKLAAVPAHPTNPGAPGANEYFSADFLTDIAFQVEANAKQPGWKDPKAAPVRKAIQDLMDGFKISEVTP